MSEIEWREPPAPRPRKVDLVAAQLRSRPGEWARIDSGPASLLPWWGSLHRADGFEVRLVRNNPSELFGPRDVYARYVPVGDAS